MNDPVYGPATRPGGRSGSFTSWVPHGGVVESMTGNCTTFSGRRAADILADTSARFEYSQFVGGLQAAAPARDVVRPTPHVRNVGGPHAVIAGRKRRKSEPGELETRLRTE